MNEQLLQDRRVAPSILASDFARLGVQVAEVMDAGARVIHVDVMDGHFVPPISIGPLIVAALSDQVHDAGGLLDVHLMVERPERQVQDFASAGTDGALPSGESLGEAVQKVDAATGSAPAYYMVNCAHPAHFEATPNIHYALHAIRKAGCAAGLALNPGTPTSAVDALAGAYDLLLCMTVNPGWGGQPYIPTSDAKIAALRERIPASTPLEVDGGIDADTAGPAAAAGATLFVAGSSIFGAPDPATAYRQVAEAAGAS